MLYSHPTTKPPFPSLKSHTNPKPFPPLPLSRSRPCLLLALATPSQHPTTTPHHHTPPHPRSALPRPALLCLILPCLNLLCLSLPWSYLTLPYPTLPFFPLPYSTLPYLTLPSFPLPYLTLPCPALPRSILPRPVLSYPLPPPALARIHTHLDTSLPSSPLLPSLPLLPPFPLPFQLNCNVHAPIRPSVLTSTWHLFSLPRAAKKKREKIRVSRQADRQARSGGGNSGGPHRRTVRAVIPGREIDRQTDTHTV